MNVRCSGLEYLSAFRWKDEAPAYEDAHVRHLLLGLCGLHLNRSVFVFPVGPSSKALSIRNDVMPRTNMGTLILNLHSALSRRLFVIMCGLTGYVSDYSVFFCSDARRLDAKMALSLTTGLYSRIALIVHLRIR